MYKYLNDVLCSFILYDVVVVSCLQRCLQYIMADLVVRQFKYKPTSLLSIQMIDLLFICCILDAVFKSVMHFTTYFALNRKKKIKLSFIKVNYQ